MESEGLMVRMKWLPVLFIFVFLAGCKAISAGGPSSPKIDASKVGVVFMHGKGGNPGRNITELLGALILEGYQVVSPEMPWSGSRGYDATYQDALLEIKKAVRSLRDSGARYIFVGGHSIGANAAIGYAAYHGGISGVLGIAPGHVPENFNFWPDVKRAKAMMKEGKGDEIGTFPDKNQGTTADIFVTARIYVSYFDPEGPAGMSLNLMKIKKGIPLFMAVAKNERFKNGGAFSWVPDHPMNKFIEVDSGHREASDAAASDAALWIQKVVALKQKDTPSN